MSKKKNRDKKLRKKQRKLNAQQQAQVLKFTSLGDAEATAGKFQANAKKIRQQESRADFSKGLEKPITIIAYLGEMLVFGIIVSLLPFGLISLMCRLSASFNTSLDAFLDNSPNAAGAGLIGIILVGCLAWALIHHQIKQYLKAHGRKSVFFEVT